MTVIGEQMANLAALLTESPFLRIEPKLPHLPVPALKRLLQKSLLRGSIAEISGRRSSGRTSLALSVLAQGTARGEICAVVDLEDSFDPASAAQAGVRLDCLVWVRCQGNAEHAMRAADLLLHAGGFGIVLLDLCDATAKVLNRIPLSYWYRFRRAIEHTPTILAVCAETSVGKCSTSSVHLRRKQVRWSGTSPFLLLQGLEVDASLKAAAGAPEKISIRTAA
jgi:recA bacterial DNA recombination protein